MGAKIKLLGAQGELLGTKVKCAGPVVGFRDAYLDIFCSGTADEVYGCTYSMRLRDRTHHKRKYGLCGRACSLNESWRTRDVMRQYALVFVLVGEC